MNKFPAILSESGVSVKRSVEDERNARDLQLPNMNSTGWAVGSGKSALSPRTRNVLDSKLLIIDDEPINARILEKSLRQAGYRQVITHTDCETALETILTQIPDVILCDVCMPVCGLEILRAVNADPDLSRIPMIMVTASDDESVRAEALELVRTNC